MAKGSYVGQIQIGDNTYPIGSILYGTCTTAAATAAKTVNDNNLTTSTFTNDNLTTGVTIHIKFTYSNTVSNPTLKIGGADAKSIMRYGTTTVSTSAATSWQAGAIVSFTYDGTNWVMNTGIDSNTTYTAASNTPSAIATTGAVGTATTYARGDHVHAISVATGDAAGQVKIADTNISVNGWSSKANLASPEFTGTPKAPTASAGTNTTQIATTAFVTTAISNSFAANDAMQFKGVIDGGSTGDYGALTSAANAGDTYKIATAGKINGVAVEVGDMIICTVDNTAAATTSNYETIAANWAVIQTNIDGAVTGPDSSTNNNLVLFNGATGKIIKDSGVTLNSSSGSTTKWLTEKGTWTTPTASNIGLGNVTNAAQITKGTFTQAYQIMYSTAASAPAVLNPNTDSTKKFLSMTGANSAGAAPTWSAVSKSDVGLGDVENIKLSTWIGSENITTLGTVATGTWSAATIAVNNGGTGKTSWTQWGVLYASATTTLANTGAGTSGQLLKSNGSSAPSWSTFSAGALPALNGSNSSASVSNGTLTLTNSSLTLNRGSLPSFS